MGDLHRLRLSLCALDQERHSKVDVGINKTIKEEQREINNRLNICVKTVIFQTEECISSSTESEY